MVMMGRNECKSEREKRNKTKEKKRTRSGRESARDRDWDRARDRVGGRGAGLTVTRTQRRAIGPTSGSWPLLEPVLVWVSSSSASRVKDGFDGFLESRFRRGGSGERERGPWARRRKGKKRGENDEITCAGRAQPGGRPIGRAGKRRPPHVRDRPRW